MDKMLFVAMSGARQTESAMTANTHNLANVNTTGFRADLAAFRAMPVYGPGHPSRVYAMAERPGASLAPGTIQSTGRDLDVAIKGDGYLVVQTRDGTEAYTRRGDLRVGSTGLLETGDGRAVMGNGGPITIPAAEKIEIASDGSITIRASGQSAKALSVVDRLKLVRVDADKLVKGTDGLLRHKDGVVADPNAAVQLISGALEGSNVNAVEALVNMISLQRQYEMQVKLMREAQENDAASATTLRL
jgi:flagellar basal-body rod protein FlgF